MALLESLQFAACVLSRRPVGCRTFTQRPVEGNLKTLQGNEKPRKATEIYHSFSGKFPEKLHPTTRPCANTSWYWGKTDTRRHLDNQKHPHSQQLQVIPVIPILETVPQMFAGNRVNSSAFCCTLASIPLTYKYQVNAR